ncbi:MAG TPA: S-layer homology domain-containing protein, partial [Allocoleopsis sp.]
LVLTPKFFNCSLLLFLRSNKFYCFVKNNTILVSFITYLLIGCANTTTGENLERSLKPDPQIKSAPVTLTPNSPTPSPATKTLSLPADFPKQIPIFPESQLLEIEAKGSITKWKSDAPINAIQSFYQKALSENKWQLSDIKSPEKNNFIAHQDKLELKISLNTAKLQTSGSEIMIEYTQLTEAKKPESQPVNPPKTEDKTQKENQPVSDSSLQKYESDLIKLDILDMKESNFEPQKIITRREYVKWLIAVNNKYYQNNPSKQIKLATETSDPVFQDVKKNDPDFPSIQGLAESGLIPSSLTGDNTTVLFRPDSPLTRENLILWKIPLDIRSPLPNANFETIKQTWGFQDSAKINPQAMKAILADFQNGDKANIKRFLGFTTLFQPQKPVTRGETAAVLWYIGTSGEGISASDVLKTTEK